MAKEREAVLERVPEPMKRALPRDPVRLLLAGQRPAEGFGLSGGPGGGKTACLAALLRRSLEVALGVKLEEVDEIPSSYNSDWFLGVGRLRWVHWPSWAAWAKATVAKRNGGEEVEDDVAALITTPLLVLDDLGRERVRGTYGEDFALGQLDRILDARDREGGRTVLWSTNAAEEDLPAIYGAAMMSRLLGMAPLVRLPDLPDQRLR